MTLLQSDQCTSCPKETQDTIHTCMSVIMPRCTGLEVKRHLFLSSLNTFKVIQTSSQVSTPRSTTRFASLPSHLDWSTSGRWPGITLCACVNLRFFCCRAWEFVFICCIIVTMAFSSAIFSGASAPHCYHLEPWQSKVFRVLHLWLQIDCVLDVQGWST